MVKHPKQAFGISEDGTVLRLVRLIRDRDQVYLHDVDRIDLERSLYNLQEELPVAAETKAWEDEGGSDKEIKLDEFENVYSPDIKTSPWETMFNSYYLRQGVIALNISEEHLIKAQEQIEGARKVKQFVKSQLSPQEFKAKEWQTCQVKINQRPCLWLHKGPNQLFNILAEYARKHKHQFYYQLADSNDIALTDYFRVNCLEKDKRTLLVYLGVEYRRAFMFDKGEWITTLPLQITQSAPTPEIVYSKLALALDSAQLSDPEQLVICGDLVNAELLEYLSAQYPPNTVSILNFAHIVVNSQRSDLYENIYLAQFALPLSLAYKALFPEDLRYTHSNFLPHKTLESQKTFKVAWHGLIVLGIIFLLTLFGTVSMLKVSSRLKSAKTNKRVLDHTLAQRRIEAAEIQEIRTKLEQQQKVFEVMRGILDGKNPWTEVLDILNRKVASLPITWLTNLKKSGERLVITGITTNRQHILSIANALPNSGIIKVTEAEIKDRRVWDFEIQSDLPKKDWIAEIENDLRKLMDMKQQYGEDPSQTGSPEAPKGKAAAETGPQKASTAQVKNLAPYRGLSPIMDKYMPQVPDNIIKKGGDDLKEYYAFIASINRGNMWEYRDLGVKFLNRHSSGTLADLVRWYMAYRLYIDKEFSLVHVYNEPLISSSTELYPWALLLAARVDYARNSTGYKNRYDNLKNDYSRHIISGQIKEDLRVIEGAAK